MAKTLSMPRRWCLALFVFRCVYERLCLSPITQDAFDRLSLCTQLGRGDQTPNQQGVLSNGRSHATLGERPVRWYTVSQPFLTRHEQPAPISNGPEPTRTNHPTDGVQATSATVNGTSRAAVFDSPQTENELLFTSTTAQQGKNGRDKNSRCALGPKWQRGDVSHKSNKVQCNHTPYPQPHRVNCVPHTPT